jgi:hypothetical protein
MDEREVRRKVLRLESLKVTRLRNVENIGFDFWKR